MSPEADVDLGTRLGSWVDRLVGIEHLEHGGRPSVVACSGGADSLALLALTVAAGLAPVAVYVDHKLRDDGDREAALVARAAATLGVPARSESVQLGPGPNLEARARDARYAALERSRVALGAAEVFVGHTADDQAETVLLNLLRGSSAAGLGAMAVQRGSVVRPLLALRRADTEAVCERMGFEPARDPMNRDLAYRRVWIREHVLPALSAGAQRDLVPLLARQAEVLRSESDYLDELARAAWPPPADQAPAAVLARLPIPLARRAVRQWIGSPPPSFAEVERVLAVARGDIRGTELAGHRRVERRVGALRVVRGSVAE